MLINNLSKDSLIPISTHFNNNSSSYLLNYYWDISLNLNIYTRITIASSYDGIYIVAIGFITGPVYISNNRGESFRSSSIVDFFYTAAISGNGQYIILTTSYQSESDHLYISSDYGNQWTKIRPPLNNGFSAISYSYNGKYVYGVQSIGDFFLSTDYGLTWSLSDNAPKHKTWSSISCTSSGEIVVTTEYYKGNVYVSNDYGLNWNVTTLEKLYWKYISVSSDDGKYIGVIGYVDVVTYPLACAISHNYGVGEWFFPFPENKTFGYPTAISVSSSGRFMVIAFLDHSVLFMSTDHGISWSDIVNTPDAFWSVHIVDNKYIIGGTSKTDKSSVCVGLQSYNNNITKKEGIVVIQKIIIM